VIVQRGGLERLAVDERAGVVYEDIEAARPRDEVLDHSVHLFFVAHVGAEQGAVAVGLDLLQRLFAAFLRGEIVNADEAALLGEHHGGRGADAAAGAGDQDLFAFEIFVHHFALVRWPVTSRRVGACH